jgi:hypothetical protein
MTYHVNDQRYPLGTGDGIFVSAGRFHFGAAPASVFNSSSKVGWLSSLSPGPFFVSVINVLDWLYFPFAEDAIKKRESPRRRKPRKGLMVCETNPVCGQQ